MGPHNAFSYADLAMTEIDHKILHHDDRLNDLVFPPDWSRFRYDCFSPWFGSHDDLVRYKDWLNSLSPSIKFTVKPAIISWKCKILYSVSLMAALSLRYIQNP